MEKILAWPFCLLLAATLLISGCDGTIQVTIDSPQDGGTFNQGDAVLFSGSAADSTGAEPQGLSLVWSSSIDGKIGTGNSFTKTDLSAGEHTITLTATGTHGRKGYASVKITVQGGTTTPTTTAPSNATTTSTVSGSTTTTVSGATTTTPVATGSFPGTVILGRPTDNSIAFNMLAEKDLDGFLEYGIEPGIYSGTTDNARFKAGEPVEMSIDRLSQDTKYYYRIRFRETGGSDFTADTALSFHTQRKTGSSFVFNVQADSHVNDTGFEADIYTTTLNNIRADSPDFLIDLGDTFLTEKFATTRSDVTTTFTNHRLFFGLIGVPLFLVNGNHEGELGWLKNGSADNLAVWSCLDRRIYYPTPAPGGFYSGSSTAEPFTGIRDGYYSFTWGDALFVMLDPFWYTTDKPTPSQLDNNWNWTLGREQYDWLRQTLETSTARYKFVFTHHLVSGVTTEARGGIEAAPFYEWGGKSQSGNYDFDSKRSGWGQPIHQMLKANNVTILFHGHDHVFVKQDLDGIVYQECSRPSFRQADAVADATAAGYVSGDILPSPGYLRVQVTPSQVKVEYVRTFRPQDEKAGHVNGEVAFTYTIAAHDN